MNKFNMETRITELFHSIGLCPEYKGYCYLVYLVELGVQSKGMPFPRMKELYEKTADHFAIPKSRVENNIRTMIYCYWNQKNSRELFTSIIHYPVTHSLSAKEFISVLCEYVSFHLVV